MNKTRSAVHSELRCGFTLYFTIEIKSVNSRFFDCSVKIPRRFSFLEERIKSYVQKNAVSRAKVDVYVTIENHTNAVGTIKIDKEYLKGYLDSVLRMTSAL